jgi:predicted glutamine amidotransferase
MCRWLAYSGKTVRIEELLYRPRHSLIVQSLSSTMGAEPTNGDGFGIGWYGVGDEPGIFHSLEPAWNNRNLLSLSQHISSPLVFAHVRATTGTPVQETNCHPFRYKNWLFMHNGVIRDFAEVKRDLVLEIAPELYPRIEGSTDTEVLFHLALTYGLETDPVTAMEHAVGLVEDVGREHGVEHPIQMTVATTDGTRIWAFRYSSEGDSRTLFYSTKVDTLELMYPDSQVMHEVLDAVGEHGRLIVSEPLGDELPGAWNSVPERSWGVVNPGAGQDDLRSFNPVVPARRATALV